MSAPKLSEAQWAALEYVREEDRELRELRKWQSRTIWKLHAAGLLEMVPTISGTEATITPAGREALARRREERNG